VINPEKTDPFANAWCFVIAHINISNYAVCLNIHHEKEFAWPGGNSAAIGG
jgi:hypothetical protein